MPNSRYNKIRPLGVSPLIYPERRRNLGAFPFSPAAMSVPCDADADWSDVAKHAHEKKWWEQWIARQKVIYASISKNADVESLYDRPHEDKSRVLVTGPFTVESLSPHCVVAADDDDLVEMANAADGAHAFR